MMALAVGRAAVACGLCADPMRGARLLGWELSAEELEQAQIGVPGADIVDWLGGIFQDQHPNRRRSGAHYTPAVLARDVVSHTLAPLLHDASVAQITALRVVDPACGGGVFLAAALRQIAGALRDRGVAHAERVALRCVHGVDVDPGAVRVTKAVLHLVAGEAVCHGQIAVGDALTGPVWSGDPGPGLDWGQTFPQVAGRGGFHAVVGNPPFLGGKRIRTELGIAQRDAIRARRPSVSGNADLAAHFVLLTGELLRANGVFGLVLTDTIAQGATRVHGLSRLVEQGVSLYRARRSIPWPGSAQVYVSIVHGRRGDPPLSPMLDGEPVAHISSHLVCGMPERDPRPLRSRRGLCFIGCDLKGPGFVLSAARRAELVARRPSRALVLPAYITGADLVRRVDRDPRRYVIDFTGLSEQQAQERWPALMSLVRGQVYADRAERSPEVAAASPWLFWRVRQRLRDAVGPLPRCLVAAVVSKHLIWDWQPVDRVYSHKVAVVATADDAMFAVLQSSVFDAWTRAWSSTMGVGLNFTPSRCFETFVLPDNLEGLAELGVELWEARERVRMELSVGLTRARDLELSGERAGSLQLLRSARRRVDEGVRRAYGWPDDPAGDPLTDVRRSLQLHGRALRASEAP